MARIYVCRTEVALFNSHRTVATKEAACENGKNYINIP
jgi:hypothetical protein